MRLLPLAPRRKLLPLLALPVLLVAGVGVTGQPEAERSPEASGRSAIAIAGFAFGPATITVEAGASVSWINDDTAAHSIRDLQGTFAESPDLAQGDSFEAVYPSPGEYDYICGIHQYMRGTVTVT